MHIPSIAPNKTLHDMDNVAGRDQRAPSSNVLGAVYDRTGSLLSQFVRKIIDDLLTSYRKLGLKKMPVVKVLGASVVSKGRTKRP